MSKKLNKKIEHFLNQVRGIEQIAIFNISPQSVNREERTIDVIWTTGARVDRGDHHMQLSLKSEHVRMKRLQNGAPVLDAHDMPSGPCGGVGRGLHGRSEGQIGVVEKAAISDERKQGTASLRFSKRDAVKDIFNDIDDGIIRNISVGFFIHDVEHLDDDESGNPIFEAIDWEPFEISPVQAGADPDAIIRAGGSEGHRNISTGNRGLDNFVGKTIERVGEVFAEKLSERNLDKSKENDNNNNNSSEINQEVRAMSEKNKETELNETEIREAAKLEAKKVEKERAKSIREAVRVAGIDEKFAEEWIDEDVSVEDANKRALEEMKKIQDEKGTRSVNIEVGANLSADHVTQGLKNAWLVRGCANKGRYKLDEHGKEFRGLSLVRSCAAFLEIGHGVHTLLMSSSEIVHRALSTSDFPLLLEDTMNKSLLDSYTEHPQTFEAFVRRVLVDDFKQISRTKYGDAPSLEEVKEGGTVKLGKISEDAEKYNVKTYAKKLRMTRKMIIDDDLDAFIRTPAKFGIAARDLESDLVWNDTILGPGGLGAVMADGNPIFDAAHLNVGPGAAFGVTSVGSLEQLLMSQKGLDGRNITFPARWIYTPVALRTKLRQFLAETNTNKDSDNNPFKDLRGGSEPRLDASSATRFYVFSNASDGDMVELAGLTGTGGNPSIETKELGGVAGIEVEAIHDVAAKAVEHRGMTTDAGV